MRILVESVTKGFNETLLAYSLTPMLKKKYPQSIINIGCNKFETNLFRRARLISNVFLQSMYGNPARWTQYELIIREKYYRDNQWNPSYYFQELDNPEGWESCLNDELRIGFDFLDSDYDFFDKNVSKDLPKDKKLVGVYYTVPRVEMGDSWEIFVLNLHKYVDMIKKINDSRDDIHFVIFTTFPTPVPIDPKAFSHLNNITILGAVDLITMGILFEKIDLLVGVSSTILNSYSMFFDVDRLVLSTIEDTGDYLWSGIPDICSTSHLRLLTMTEAMKTDWSWYLYPLAGSPIVKWSTYDLLGQPIEKNMRSLEGIVDIDEKIIDILDNRPVDKEQICLSCKQKDNCAYWWNNKNIIPRIGEWYWNG